MKLDSVQKFLIASAALAPSLAIIGGFWLFLSGHKGGELMLIVASGGIVGIFMLLSSWKGT
jgi:hypothetical protein